MKLNTEGSEDVLSERLMPSESRRRYESEVGEVSSEEQIEIREEKARRRRRRRCKWHASLT